MSATVKEDTSTLSVGEGVVVLRRKGRSAVTANILGEELDRPEKGIKTLWLDRAIHESHEATLGGHPVGGAFVTEVQLLMDLQAIPA
jgi:hypothetical protein